VYALEYNFHPTDESSLATTLLAMPIVYGKRQIAWTNIDYSRLLGSSPRLRIVSSVFVLTASVMEWPYFVELISGRSLNPKNFGL